MTLFVKEIILVAIILSNVLIGETGRHHHKYRAFKNCKGRVCAARVSFCIIMKDCGCGASVKNGEFCSCCEDCYRCLGVRLWRKCCNCVGLCGRFSVNDTENVGIPSKHGDLPGHSLPTLFEAMSSGHTDLPLMFMSRQGKGGHTNQNYSSPRNQCKVAFFDKCLARESCITSCSAMGAHRYRWFRNGCCQCVGKSCNDYGELQSLCKSCLAD